MAQGWGWGVAVRSRIKLKKYESNISHTLLVHPRNIFSSPYIAFLIACSPSVCKLFTGPLSTKLDMKGIQVCSNKGPHPFLYGR